MAGGCPSAATERLTGIAAYHPNDPRFG